MAIRITPPGRDFTVTIEGTTFTLRRLAPQEDQRLRHAHTHKGRFDAMLYAVAKLEACTVGWDAIEVDGVPTGYDRTLIAHLPDSVMSQLLDAVNEGLDPLAPGSRPTSTPSSPSPSGSGPTRA